MIIQTKLKVPSISNTFISRPKLYKLLDQGLDKRVTFVVAPSGYGKTSILSDWVKRLETFVAWVTLDERDNHPHSFWTHVAASLQPNSLFRRGQLSRLLDKHGKLPWSVADLLNELSMKREQTILVWDDFNYITDADVLAEVNQFIRLLPEQVHVYLVSQAYSSLQVAKMKAANELLEIDKSDLQFSPSETKLFFSLYHDLDLRNEQIFYIHEQLQGWAAGLRLAAMSMLEHAGSSEPWRHIMGQNKDFAAYFFDEILSSLSERQQQLLYRSSILEEMNAELCVYVSDLGEGEELRSLVEQGRLFTASIEGVEGWFRYHPLFRQFLQFQLKQKSPGLSVQLHARAGRWMEQSDKPLQALHYYLHAEAYESMAKLLAGILFHPGSLEKPDIRYWFDRIPLKFLFSQPRLYLLHIVIKLVDGKLEESRRCCDRLRQRLFEVAAEQNEENLKVWRTGLLLIETLYAYKTKNFLKSIEHWSQYIQADPKEKLFEGVVIPSDSIISLRDLHTHIGSLKGAEVLLKRFLGAGAEGKSGVISTEINISYIALLYEWNHLELAEQYARQLLDDAQACGIMQVAIRVRLVLSAIELARSGDKGPQCLVDIQQLQKDIEPLENLELEKSAALLMTTICLRMGEADKAEEWLLDNKVSIAEEIPTEQFAAYRIYTRLLLMQGKQEEAEEWAYTICEHARATGDTLCLIRSLALLGLVLYQSGQLSIALDVLEEALHLGETEGCVRSFADYDGPMVELLRVYLKSRQSHYRTIIHKVSLMYVKRLVHQAKVKPNTTRPMEELMGPDAEASLLTVKEQEVLLLLHEGLSNKLIAEKMGISMATVKTHVNNMYKKLEVPNRVLAIEKARQKGLL